jgi:EmrB/QacA subfamily drug resistance transporter
MVVLDASVVNVALPVIQNKLHFDQNSLQWVINAYTIVFAGFLLLGGRFADLFGRRRVFLVGIAVFTLSSLVGGLAYNAPTLIIARAVQGLGAAIMAPSTLTVLFTTFTDPKARGKAFGLWGAVAGGGGAVGVLAGGIITQWLSWRWILLVNVPIGVVLFLVTAYAVTESKLDGKERRIDVVGAVAVTLGLMALVFGVGESTRYGWGSPQVLGALAVGVVIMAFFVYEQAKLAKQPLVPLSIFRYRSLTYANIVNFCGSAALFSVFYFFTLFLQQVLHYTPLQTGLAYVPLSLGIFVGARGFAPFVPRLGGPRIVLAGGLTLSVLGLLWLSQLSETSTFLGNLLGPTILLGLGQGMVSASVAMAGSAGVPYQQAGLASGLLNANRQLGGAIGLAILVAVATARIHSVGTTGVHALASGYSLAFLVSVVFPLIGIVAALMVPKATSE